MKNCNCHEEIPRDGSGQLERYLKALDPATAPIDGRSIDDLLVFARRYAEQIRFYNVPESKIEDGIPPEKVSWVEFFRRDMAVIASSIANTDLANLKRDYDQNRLDLDAQPSGTALKIVFQQIIALAAEIDVWYAIAIPDNPLYADLDLAIKSSLAEQAKKIVAYSEAYQSIDIGNPMVLDISAIKDSGVWGVTAGIPPDATIYQGVTLEDKIRYAALYADDSFQVFYAFLSDLIELKAPAYLKFALESYPAHQPHMALFITFLTLFQHAQAQMNQITGRMLDFYYQDVLRLAPKPSIPDRVHMVFELAKDVTTYDLAQGTALKAGKDAAGKEQIYITETDLVVNQAKVKELKTLYIQKSSTNANAINAIYARPIANSQDGFGAAFTDPSGKWPTFGQGMPPNDPPKNICQSIAQAGEFLSRKDQGNIGFGLASPQLLLQGGNRMLVWESDIFKRLFICSPIGSIDLGVWLTGEKGWLQINQLNKPDFLKEIEGNGVFNPAHIPQEAGYFLDETCKLYLFLPVNSDAIVPFDGSLHGAYRYQTSSPVLQILLGPKLTLNYDELTGMAINQRISVWVGSIIPSLETGGTFSPPLDGLKKLVLQNDNGLLDANKPFDPFTLYPSLGKSFYIGSSEVFNKPLGRLAIDIKHTQNSIDNEIIFNACVLSERRWMALDITTGADFSTAQLTTNILKQQQTDAAGNKSIVPVSLDRKPIAEVSEYQAQTLKGFIQLEFNFSRLVTESLNAAKTLDLQASQALAPYLQIKEITVSYQSDLNQLDPDIDQFFHVYPFGVAEVALATTDNIRCRIEQNILSLKSLEPFSTSAALNQAANDLRVDAKDKLLPAFSYLDPNQDFTIALANQAGSISAVAVSTAETVKRSMNVMNLLTFEASGLRRFLKGANNQYSASLQEQGILYIGLEKLQPLDSLSLLFQFAEGSADDEDNDPPAIHWSYLCNNQWQPLPGENLISDGTYGFQATGIVKIDVPADITDHNTIITDGLRWFAASVSENSERIPGLVNVVAQAVEARFQDNGNLPAHSDSALPAGSIAKLVVNVAKIGKVEQPFASFDGKHREVGREFHTRASERLRHKARAITAWDYEHLVLDRFPGIFKVKCITHADPDCSCRKTVNSVRTTAGTTTPGFVRIPVCCGPQIAPGHVLIVPIAGLKNRNAVNPLQPKTSRRTLLAIQDYLSQRSSPFVKIRAKNPLYEQVLVVFRVQFTVGSDKGFYLKKLNDELVQYLTPWAFDETVEVSFVQKIYASAIINFIEKRPYVDFITDFLMFVCLDECCPAPVKVVEEFGDSETTVTLNEILARISGCCDLESLIARGDHFHGKVIAEPSTSRSILVSAPKHIILPYEPPKTIPPCERPAKTKLAEADDETQNLWPEVEN